MSYLIVWFIWAERNRSRHQLIEFKPYNVVWQVQNFVRNSMSAGITKPKHWNGVRMKMSIPSEAVPSLPRPLAIPVRWHPPDPSMLKINTDGALSDVSGKAAGGGLIRNAMGKLILAYATPLDAHSASEAEHKAAHFGLSLAMGLSQSLLLEMDSEQALKLINGSG